MTYIKFVKQFLYYNLKNITNHQSKTSVKHPEMVQGIVDCKRQEHKHESTLALKPMGNRVIQCPKRRVLEAPQNGPQSNKNFLRKKIISKTFIWPRNILSVIASNTCILLSVSPFESMAFFNS